MFYCLLFFLILISILCVLNIKNHWAKPLIFLIISYFLAICCMIIYISKHTYYYNVITNYFVLPKFLWKKLFFLSIDRFHLIRILNWSCSAIVLFSVYFTFSILKPAKDRAEKLIIYGIALYFLIINILYDPGISIKIYYHLYPAVFTVREYAAAQNIFHRITQGINYFILIATLIALLHYCINAAPVKVMRIHLLIIVVSYCVMCICYFTFLSFAPNWYLTISKTAGTYYYQPIRLSTNTLKYQLSPFLLVFAAIIISVFYLQYSNYIKRIENANLSISRQIDAAETTSKVFCHFIKNELLNIQSEIAVLPASTENEQQIRLLLEHCRLLYNRIDSIHRSTKTSKLYLKKSSIQNILHSTLKLFASELKQITVVKSFPQKEVYIFADEQYLEQALHNLIRNAITALLDKEKTSSFFPTLTFRLYQTGKWIIFTVEDNGIGISEKNLSQIFTPFFSSKPFSEHWGIGLSLTHKIISAHDGQIQVESTPGMGTCFKILLPNVYHINF